jgi:hypothetical protein
MFGSLRQVRRRMIAPRWPVAPLLAQQHGGATLFCSLPQYLIVRLRQIASRLAPYASARPRRYQDDAKILRCTPILPCKCSIAEELLVRYRSLGDRMLPVGPK